MKKLIVIIAALLFLATFAEAAASQNRFLNKMEKAIYQGSRSGKLSKREVRHLNTELSHFEKLLWQYKANGKISKRESRKLKIQEDVFEIKLQKALFNKERANNGKAFKKDKKQKHGNAKVVKTTRQGPICRLPPRPAKDERY